MMNIPLADVFLECLSSQVRTSFQQLRLCEPNIVFINMFLWFVATMGKQLPKTLKPIVNGWLRIGIRPTDLITSSSASLPAQPLQAAPAIQ
jgi:hypothetical protein